MRYNAFIANDDGKFQFCYHIENKYSNDGKQTRELTYNAEGNLKEDKIYDVK